MRPAGQRCANTPPGLPAETSASTGHRATAHGHHNRRIGLGAGGLAGCSPMAIISGRGHGQLEAGGIVFGSSAAMASWWPTNTIRGRRAARTLDIRLWKAVAAHGIRAIRMAAPLAWVALATYTALYRTCSAVDNRGLWRILGAYLPPWWNWHTQQVEGLCPYGRTGSSPVGGIDWLSWAYVATAISIPHRQ